MTAREATVQVLPTVVLGLLGIYIAWRQWRTARDRLVLDLFDRRFQTFQDLTRANLEALHNKVHPDIADLAKFDAATEKARFLFGPEIHKYLDEVRPHLINLITKGRALSGMPNGPARDRSEQEMVDALTEMQMFYEKLANMLAPYMRMSTRG